MPRPRPALFTSRYQAKAKIIASGCAPVKITVGHPRFRLGYELAGSIRELAPLGGLLTIEDEGQFFERYFARLSAIGVERLRSRSPSCRPPTRVATSCSSASRI